MKKVISITLFICNILIAQQNIFQKIEKALVLDKNISEKIEQKKSRGNLKNFEILQLKEHFDISKNHYGVFNIFDKLIEYEITEGYGVDINGIQSYKAKLKGGGNALICSSENGIYASIWCADGFYSFESLEGMLYFISEIDVKQFSKNERQNDYMKKNILRKSKNSKTVNSVMSPATVSVFVAYTPSVAQAYGSNIDYLINSCIGSTTTAYSRSSVNSSMVLAGSTQLNYTESNNSYTDVTRFQGTSDGYLDEIHSLRNQYQADICVLLVNSLDANGITYSIGAFDYSEAFCVVKASAAVSYYTFPHETAHLFGCRHNIEDDNNTEPYPEAHGFHANRKLSEYNPISREYCTIMDVYNTDRYQRVGYFSNPEVDDDIGQPMGETNKNNVYALNQHASILASFQPRYTTSGIISVNEWWRGNITVTGTVTVASGVTLTVEPGATISFASSASITVNGTLYAVGNTSNPITFTKSSTSNWGGIQFNSGSSGNLQYCNIQNAGNGIYCYNSSPTIKYSTIDNNYSTGLYLNYYSSPVLKGNNFRFNGSYGIRCESYSSPNLTDYGYPGLNVIRNNGAGIVTSYYSNPNLNG